MSASQINQIGEAGGNTPIADDTKLGASWNYQIPQDGSTIQCKGYWGPSRSLFAQNFSADQNMLIQFDTGFSVTVAPGNREGYNVPFGTARVHYAAATTSAGMVTLYSDLQNVTSAVHNVSVTNVVNISGNVGITGNVNIGNTVTIQGNVGITGNVNIGNTVTITGNVGITGSVTIGNTITVQGTVTVGSITNTVTISGTVQDLIVENNTTALAGVLPATVVAFTLLNNSTVSQTIGRAITGFSLSIQPFDGFLSILYTASGQDNYLMRQMPFYAPSNIVQPLEKEYSAPIPSGAVLKLTLEQAPAGGFTGVLKY